MTRRTVAFLSTVLGLLTVITVLAGCGEQVTNVFSNIVAPGGATPSP